MVSLSSALEEWHGLPLLTMDNLEDFDFEELVNYIKKRDILITEELVNYIKKRDILITSANQRKIEMFFTDEDEVEVSYVTIVADFLNPRYRFTFDGKSAIYDVIKSMNIFTHKDMSYSV